MSRVCATASCVNGIPSRNANTPATYSRNRVMLASLFAACLAAHCLWYRGPACPDIAQVPYAATSTICVISAGANTRIGGPQNPVPRET